MHRHFVQEAEQPVAASISGTNAIKSASDALCGPVFYVVKQKDSSGISYFIEYDTLQSISFIIWTTGHWKRLTIERSWDWILRQISSMLEKKVACIGPYFAKNFFLSNN